MNAEIHQITIPWTPPPSCGYVSVQRTGPKTWVIESRDECRGLATLQRFPTQWEAFITAFHLADDNGLDLHAQGDGRK